MHVQTSGQGCRPGGENQESIENWGENGLHIFWSKMVRKLYVKVSLPVDSGRYRKTVVCRHHLKLNSGHVLFIFLQEVPLTLSQPLVIPCTVELRLGEGMQKASQL